MLGWKAQWECWLVYCVSAQKAENTKGQYITTTIEADCYSLLISDGLVAAVTHPHLKLEAHEGDGGAFGRAFAAHCLATLSTVVLRNTEDFGWKVDFFFTVRKSCSSSNNTVLQVRGNFHILEIKSRVKFKS